MTNAIAAPEPGDVVEINAAGNLPFGLTDGFQVRLVRILDSARRLVEREGREWILESAQIRPRRFRNPVPDCRPERNGAKSREVAPHRTGHRAWSPSSAWGRRVHP